MSQAAFWRRKLLVSSIVGVILALVFLGSAFKASETHSDTVISSTCPIEGIKDCHGCLWNVSSELCKTRLEHSSWSSDFLRTHAEKRSSFGPCMGLHINNPTIVSRRRDCHLAFQSFTKLNN